MAVLERNFADYYDLPPNGTVGLGGGVTLDIVGIGMAPEYFFITTEDGGFFAQANFAALFTSLTTAQEIAGRPGQVNDLVLALRDGADVETVRSQVQAAFDASDTGLGVTVMTKQDEDAYRILYDDIEGDRQFWNVFAGLILVGAAFGAFNLSSRMVEAQRRELGIGMALGASRVQLAMRPMLVGVEIAIAGVVMGIAIGALAVELIRPVYTTMLPLPVWITDFQWDQFVRGARTRVHDPARRNGLAGVAVGANDPGRRDRDHPSHPARRSVAPAAPAPVAAERVPPHATGQRAAHSPAHPADGTGHRRSRGHARGHPRHDGLVRRHHGPQRCRGAGRPPRPGRRRPRLDRARQRARGRRSAAKPTASARCHQCCSWEVV